MDDSAKPRRAASKRLRFEVFNRDHFTCQYCGAQPPDVVLVLDHVVPVSQEGTTTNDNLVTACESCNQGKAHRPLGGAPVRPDADLLYLQTQQEIAELKRYRVASKELTRLRTAFIDRLQREWYQTAETNWHIPTYVIENGLDEFGPEITEEVVHYMARRVYSDYLQFDGYRDPRIGGYFHKVAQGKLDEASS